MTIKATSFIGNLARASLMERADYAIKPSNEPIKIQPKDNKGSN